MRQKFRRPAILAGVILGGFVALSIAAAANEALVLTVSPPQPGGGATASMAIQNVADIESFGLELAFGSGTSLTLKEPEPTEFARDTNYFPYAPFNGSTVDLNDYHRAISDKKIYISGFKPTGTSGNIGIVTFNVNPAAISGDSQVLSLSGQFYGLGPDPDYPDDPTKTKIMVRSFAPVFARFKFGPNILVTPNTKNYGNASGTQTFTVANTGNLDLTIGAMKTEGTNAADFILKNNNCSSATVTPSNSCTFQVAFSRTLPGGKTAKVSIPSNDPDNRTFTVSLLADDIPILVAPGDIDGDGSVGLGDAILALKVTAKLSTAGYNVNPSADVNGDSRIGLYEALYILQKIAGGR